MARLIACAALVLALVSVLGSGASAAPIKSKSPDAFFTTLNCGTESFDVVVIGQGNWSVAHLADGKGVFHPTAFPSFVGTVTDSEGNIVEEINEPPVAKKNVPNNKAPILHCSYTVSFTDPEAGLTFSGTGTVEGYITPFRR